MKKKVTLLVSLFTITSLMAGCSQTSSNTSSSSNNETPSSSDNSVSSTEEAKNKISFEDAAKLVASLEKSEYSLSNGGVITTSSNSNGYVIKKVENTKVYLDESSSSTGTLVRTSPMGRTLQEDTFNARKKRQMDLINVDSKETSYNMYYDVIDYEKAEITSYSDSASRVYVMNTVSDANAAGLSEGQYVLAGQYSKYTSSQVCVQVETALDDLYNDDYVLAYGITSIYYDTLANGNIKYYLTVDYSYDGDLNDTYAVSKDLSFEVSSDKTKLLNASYDVKTTDTSKSDSSDVYVSGNTYQATLNYGDRVAVDESTLLEVEDYFLENVTDIKVLMNNAKGNREECDPTSIVYDGNNNYIFLEGKTYTPLKAVNVSLTNKSSSNEEVVKLESSGHFLIVGPGSATLTATYSGRDEFGVYVEKEISVDVTISKKEISEFGLYTEVARVYETITSSSGELSKGVYKGDITKAYDNTMYEKNNYTFTIVANASGSASYVATSSDETKAKVVVDDGSVTVYAMTKGEVTITISLEDKPEISYSIRFTILDSDDVLNALKGKTYTVDRMIYHWTGEMSFNDDGKTGTKTIYSYSEDNKTLIKTTTTSFTYSIVDGYIVLDDDSYSFASLTNNGSNLYCEYGTGMIHHDYKVKA